MKRPVESEYTSQVAYTRALEAYCNSLAQPPLPEQERVAPTCERCADEIVENNAGLCANCLPAICTEQEPVCPDCKAKVLYECVACSSNNYPPKPEERNFCPRCGKRTADLTTIHTCTPPRDNT